MVVVVPAVACPNDIVHKIDVSKDQDDERDPIHSRQGKHGSDEGEKPFPWSTLESVGAIFIMKIV
jgi:hypothetical protein